jgi:hypothetical protein
LLQDGVIFQREAAVISAGTTVCRRETVCEVCGAISPRVWIQGKMMKACVVETTAGNLGRSSEAGYGPATMLVGAPTK